MAATITTEQRSSSTTRGRSTRVLSSLLAVAAGTAYLTWRIGWTVGDHLWLALPLLAVEAVFFARFALFVGMALPEPPPVELEPDDRSPIDASSMELLVPAAHAGRDELSRTLAVATGVGATTIRVLDRIDRPQLRREAHRFGATYEIHAVAGEGGSAALVESARADAATNLIAWVDAGDVVLPAFWQAGSLLVDPSDPPVAVVQSATELVNSDSLMHLVPDRDDLALENRVVGPSLGGCGSAPWNGSGSIFRNDAIDSVGGLPSVAVSTHRVVARLAHAGWHVRWSAQSAVRTVAPDVLGEHLAHVGATARGHFSMLFGGDSPLIPRGGLPPRRRVAQLFASTAVLDGAARLTLVAVITATLLSGRLPFDAPLGLLAVAFALQAGARAWATVRLGRGAVGLGDATRHGLRRMGVHVVGLVRAPRSTTDGTRGGIGSLGRLRLLTAALVVLDLALILRGLTFVVPGLLPRLDGASRFAALAAGVWAVTTMIDVLQLLVGRVQRRASHRSVTDLVARIGEDSCRVIDLTPHGIGFLAVTPPEDGDVLGIELDVPRLDGTSTSVVVSARIRHVSAEPDLQSGRYRAGASFEALADSARDALVEFCALTADHRDAGREAPATVTPEDLVVGGSGFGRRLFGALSALAVLFSGLVVAAGPASAESMEPGTAVITGRVLGVDGQPVQWMCVQIGSGPSGAWGSSGVDGSFALGGLTPGTYTVMAGNCGMPGVVPTYAPSTVWHDQASTLTVAADETVAVGDLTLAPAGTLQGSVFDEGGAPLEMVCASFIGAGTGTSEQWFWAGSTDAAGQFTATIPAGVEGRVQFRDCQVPQRVVDTWYQLPGDPPTGTSVNVAAGSSVVLDPVTMHPGIVVSGRVTDNLGTPQQNVCVSLQVLDSGNWQWLAGGNTDPDGNYSFMVEAGSYALGFNDCGSGSDLISLWYPSTPGSEYPPPTVEVTPAAHVFDVTMQRGGHIAGTVLDTQGAPALGACVMLATPTQMRDHKSAAWAEVHADGTWESTALPPGDYAIYYRDCTPDGQTWISELRSDIYPDFGQSFDDADLGLVTVMAGQTTAGVQDTLLRSARLSGTVTSGGQPVGGVCVGGVRGRGDQFMTAPDGTWSAVVLPGAAVEVTFTDCVAGRGLVQQARTVAALTEGSQQLLDVDLLAGATSAVSGSVRNASGSGPSTPTCVVAYVPDNMIAMAGVGSDGVFNLDGLADGDYWFGVIGCGSEDDMTIHFPGDPTPHVPVWQSGDPILMEESSSPDPAGHGVPVVDVRAASPADALVICVGGGCPPPEATPPTTTPSPTTTTVPTTGPGPAPTGDAPVAGPPATAPPVPATPPVTDPTASPAAWFAANGLHFDARRLSGVGSPDPTRALLVAWTMGRTQALAEARAQAAVEGMAELTARQRALATAQRATTTVAPVTITTVVSTTVAVRSDVPAVSDLAMPVVPSDRDGDRAAGAPLASSSADDGPPWHLAGGVGLLLGAVLGVLATRRRRGGR